jgi:hypothetical protein
LIARFADRAGLDASAALEPVSGFEPLIIRLQGRSGVKGGLLISWQTPLSSPSDYHSMPVISVPFWHGTGMKLGDH